MKLDEYRIMYDTEDRLWWYRGMERITRLLAERSYKPGQKLKILDAGCGTGAAMHCLASYGTVTGLDFSSHALRFCRQRGEARLARGSVTDLPFRDASFDLVTCFDVLSVRGVDDSKALREFRRVLVPGGRVILRLPAYGWLRGAHDRAVETGHRYRISEIKAKMAGAGIEVEHASYANMWLFPIAVLKRWAEPLLPRQAGSDLTLSVGPLNRIFQYILASEAPLIASRGLPFGLSVVAVGRRG